MTVPVSPDSAAITGPIKLTAMPPIMCTTAFLTPILQSTIRKGAANNVCIRKTGIVYFAKAKTNRLILSSMFVLTATLMNKVQAIIPIAKATIPFDISRLYTTTLATTPPMKISILHKGFKGFAGNTERDIPPINHTSFARTEDIAKIPDVTPNAESNFNISAIARAYRTVF